MEHLTTDEIIAIHDKIVEEAGEPKEVLNSGNIEFLVSKIQSSRGSIEHKAAILLEGLVNGHAFMEGNKRTGFESMRVFLRMNGKDLKIKDINETGQFINDIARGRTPIKDAEKWVRLHIGEWYG